MRYRYAKSPSGTTDGINLLIQLRQDYVNESSLGTLISEWNHTDVSNSLQTAQQTLNSVDVDNITDYSQLFVRCVTAKV